MTKLQPDSIKYQLISYTQKQLIEDKESKEITIFMIIYMTASEPLVRSRYPYFMGHGQ